MTAVDANTVSKSRPPQRPLVLLHMLRQRRRSTLWWSVAVTLTSVVFASAYPSVKESSADLESYMDSLPEGLVELFGADAGIGTPAGYLNSQLYANVYPLLLMILGIGAAAWTVAGSEGDGTLEMLLASPVRRVRVAVERLMGVVIITGIVALVSTAALAASAPAFELSGGLGGDGLVSAGVTSWLLALGFSVLSFATGAAIGRRGGAVAVGSAAAAGTYVLYGITAFVEPLRPLRWLSPGYWYLDADPLVSGFSTTVVVQAVLLPLAVSAVALTVGILRFTRRDVH